MLQDKILTKEGKPKSTIVLSVNHNPQKLYFGIIIGTLLLMFIAIYFVNSFHPCFQKLRFQRMQTLSGRLLIYSLWAILIFQIAFLFYIVCLYTSYKPHPTPFEDKELPNCTIIVPAYNEGKLVYDTLSSIARCNYPIQKMEIWAIDDGSEDDTWSWIKKAKSDLPPNNNLKIFRQLQNKGKRYALYKGFTEGNGGIFITIDSDSIVDINTIRNLVSPFIGNKNCGAVAGNVKVLNKKQAIIPKMLNVSFVFSFEFIRAAQSSLGFVLCTPGALSAYRKEALTPVLDSWIHQTFAGEKATIGEDRAMTNLILKQGYKVYFQKNARVLTNTPVRFQNLHKMFTRWGRSNVRETIMTNKFIFKDFRKGSKLGPRILVLNQWIKLILAIPLMILMFYFLITHPFLYLSSALTGSFIFSSIQMLFFAKHYNFTESLWAYPYSVLYIFGLFWIIPFSIVTVKNGGWLTR